MRSVRLGEATQLENIGLIYHDKGETDEALKYYREALEIYREIGDKREATQLENIGLIYCNKDEMNDLFFCVADIKNPINLIVKFRGMEDNVSKYLRKNFSKKTLEHLNEYDKKRQSSELLCSALVNELNRLLISPCIFKRKDFSDVRLSDNIRRMICRKPQGKELILLNRILLENVYSDELATISHDKSDIENGFHKNSLNNFFEPAIMIAFLTSCLFFIGNGYYKSFYNRLLIPLEFMEIQISTYLIRGFEISLFFLFIVFVWFFLWFILERIKSQKINSFLQAVPKLKFSWKSSSIKSLNQELKPSNWDRLFFILKVFILIILLILTFYLIFSGKFIYMYLVIFISLFFFIITKNSKNPGISYIKLNYSKFYNLEWIYKIFFAMTIVIMLYLVAFCLGYFIAEKYIIGIGEDVQELHFSLENNMELENKSLVFVLLHDDIYYFVEKDEKLPNKPKLHLYSVHEIKSITTSNKRSVDPFLYLYNIRVNNMYNNSGLQGIKGRVPDLLNRHSER